MDMESQQPAGAPEAGKGPKKPFLYFVAGLVCVILAVIIGAYVWARQTIVTLPPSPTALKIADALHIPVLRVNGETVSYARFYKTYELIKKSAANQTDVPPPTEQELSDAALVQSTGVLIMNDTAKKLHVEVTKEDIENAKQFFLSSSNMTAVDAETFLQSNFGLTLDEYVEEVGRPAILEQKMVAAFASSSDPLFTNSIEPIVTARHILFRITQTTTEEMARKGAEDAITRLNKGEDFSKLAKVLGNDQSTKDNGGALGSFTPGRMVKSFEDAALALKTGEFTKQPVKTEYGYHVIFVDERRDERSLAAYVRKQVKEAKIDLLLPLHNPFDELQKSL